MDAFAQLKKLKAQLAVKEAAKKGER